MPKLLMDRIRNLRDRRDGERGSMVIEIVIGVFILLIVLSLLVDLIILSWRFIVIGQTASYVTRTAAIQGGIHAVAPEGHPGDYLNLAQFNNFLKNSFDRAGIAPSDYKVFVNGREVSAMVPTPEIDYLEPVEVEIRVNYKWQLMSNFIPWADIEQTITSKRSALSEYKYRYDDWGGG